MSKRAFVIVAALMLGTAGGAGAGSGAPATGAAARAYAVKVLVPGQAGGGTREVAAPPDAVQAGGGFAYPEDGSVVTVASATASASAATTDSTATAKASSDVSSISIFGGEVTVAQVVGAATAQAASGEGKGNLDGSAVSGLVVLGQAVEASANQRVSLGDWGYAIVLAQGSTPGGDAYRGFVTGLVVHLTADHNGLPAGSEILLGYAEATAKAARVAPPTAQPKPEAPDGKKRGGDESRATKRPRVPPIVVRPVPAIVPELTRGGYVFPVHGPSSFSNTFGAVRAVVGWHHGEDIFAPLGAPVLAVTRGTVFSVGWNDIGGNRLWLRDELGNEFYYAHLSAFSPLAVNGRQVRPGDVLGFVGTSGDAEGTAPHLHFEIHPVFMLALGYDGVVPPYEILLAWQKLEDVRFIPGAGWVPIVGATDAPMPGAYLLSARDISSASGLEPGSLRRALADDEPSAEAPTSR